MRQRSVPRLPPRPANAVPGIPEVRRLTRRGAETSRYTQRVESPSALSARELNRTISDSVRKFSKLISPRSHNLLNKTTTETPPKPYSKRASPLLRKRCQSAELSNRIQSKHSAKIDLNRSRDRLQETCVQMDNFRGQLASFRAMLRGLDAGQAPPRVTLGAPGPGEITPDVSFDTGEVSELPLQDITNIVRDSPADKGKNYSAVAAAMQDCENHLVKIKSELAELKRFAQN